MTLSGRAFQPWPVRGWLLLGLGSVTLTMLLRALITVMEVFALHPAFPGSQLAAERIFSASVWLDIAMVLGLLGGGVIVAGLAVVCLFRGNLRRIAARFALVWVGFLLTINCLAWLPGFSFADARLPGLVRVMESSQPLVAAIERYRKDNGDYPRSLELLIPDYLPEIPKTGVPVQPEFSYRVSGKPHSDVIGCEEAYELTVYLPMEFIAQSSPDEWRRCPGAVRMVYETDRPLTRVGDWVILPGNN